MADIKLASLRVDEAFSHMVLFGFAAILENAGRRPVRLWWSDDLDPVAHLRFDGDLDDLAQIVKDHAALSLSMGWMDETVTMGGKERRMWTPADALDPDKTMAPDETQRRWDALSWAREASWPGDQDALTEALVQSMGEPAWWSLLNKTGAPKFGMSLWNMTPRNSGNEVITARIRPLATALAERPISHIAEGIAGTSCRSGLSKKSTKYGGINMRPTGAPADAALSWAAIHGWVIDLPVRALVGMSHEAMMTFDTATIPVWTTPVSLGVVRAVIHTDVFARAASGETIARDQLAERGVCGILDCPVDKSDTKSPERTAMRGQLIGL